MQCAYHVLAFIQDVCLDALLPPTGLVAVREGRFGPLQGSSAKDKAFNHSKAVDLALTGQDLSFEPTLVKIHVLWTSAGSVKAKT